MSDDDLPTAIGIVVIVLVCCGFVMLAIRGAVAILLMPDYRDGVIDAQTGKARIELIERADGTTEWGPVIAEGGDDE